MKALKTNICAAIIIALCATAAFSQVPVRYTIHWSPPAGPDVNRVLVYRSATDAANNFVPVGSVSVTDTTYADTDASLAADITYWYRLRAQNVTGTVGRFSTNAISALTISPSASPSLKNQCRIDSVVAIDTASCRVYWTTAVATTGKLRYWRMGTTSATESATAGASATHHNLVIGGLQKGIVYYVRAVAHDASGRSLLISAEQAFSTSPPAADFAIVTSTDTLTVPEGGTAQLGVKLSAQPSGPVTITTVAVGGDADITIQSGSTRSFSTSNWNAYQMVTFAAASDADTENGVATFILGVSSGGSAPAKTISAVEEDDDAISSVIQFVIEPDTLVVPEGGTAQFHVHLTYQPESNVTFSITRSAGDADITVQSASPLTFTASDWDVDKTVTLAAAADQDVTDGVATILLHETSGPGVPDARLYAHEDDDDALAFVLDCDTLVVPEAGTASFHVSLAYQPPSDVHATVARSGGDVDISVRSGASLVFTPANWNIDQTVTLAAAADVDDVNGEATILVRGSSGPSVPTASLRAVEEDGGDIFFSFDRDTVVVPEGGTAQFGVRLTARPTADVSVSVTRLLGDTDISVQSGASLLFTTANWDVAQTVTLAAAEDGDSDDGGTSILLRVVSGPAIPDAMLPAREDDNDAVDNGHHETEVSGPVVSYPMPYQPEHGSLHIAQIPVDGSVDLFDLAGRKIWSSSWSGRDEITWNGANSQSSPVASGRYFMVIKDGAGRVVDKQAILVVR